MRLTALSRGLIEVQERERRTIARELHDEIGQCLSAIRVQFAKLQRRVDDDELQALIDSAAAMTERTLGRVRSLSLLLHPPQLDTLGLEAALAWHLDEQRRLHGVAIEFEPRGLQREIHPEVATAAYRIVQESVSNALRHGCAARIVVQARAETHALLLDIRDDGRGFVPATIEEGQAVRPSLGLLGMAERARLLGGDVGVVSTVGMGTSIAALLPWK